MDASANTAELVTALWPVFAAIVTCFAVGVYVWANTRRDSKDALNASAAATEQVTAIRADLQHTAGKITGLELAIQREIAALASRVVALETRQEDILQAVLYIKENMLSKHRNRSHRSED